MSLGKRLSALFTGAGDDDPQRELEVSYDRQVALLQQTRRGAADVATSRKRLELQLRQLASSIKNSSGSYSDVKANLTYAIKEGRTGTITVTKFDGSTITGTFSMKTYNVQLKREVVITNGVFSLPVTTI